jgi:hypothetical protein
MGNRAAVSFIISSSLVFITAAVLLPSFVHAGARDAIRESVFKRICERHEAISDRINRAIGIPKFCDKPEPPPPMPVVHISADPGAITEGEEATLTWSATNATSCIASSGWSGVRPTSGSEIVTPAATTTYVLECAGPGGVDSDEVMVAVTEVPEEPIEPTVELTADPMTIDEGDSSMLTWNSENADSCTASGGSFTGAKSIDGSESVSPAETTIYSIECTGGGGAVSDSVTVTVTPAPEPEAPTLIFAANPTTVNEGSASNATSTITWDSTNTTSCEASNGWSGAKSLDGSEVVGPTATTSITYVLTCVGDGGSITKEVTLTVVPEAPSPILSLIASRLVVHEGSLSGATTTLTWNSTNVDSCTASGASEWAGAKSVDGEEEVAPTADVTYELDCTGAGGSIHAEVTIDFVPVEVEGNLLITEVLYDLSTTTEKGIEPNNEWIEIYNGTEEVIDLSGYSIGDNNGADVIADGTMLPAGAFAVIVGTSTTSSFWSIPAEAVIITLPTFIGGSGGLSNNDRVELRNAADELVDTVGWGTDTVAFGSASGLTVEVNVNHSLGREDVGVDTDAAADWVEKVTPTPGQ